MTDIRLAETLLGIAKTYDVEVLSSELSGCKVLVGITKAGQKALLKVLLRAVDNDHKPYYYVYANVRSVQLTLSHADADKLIDALAVDGLKINRNLLVEWRRDDK